MSENSKERLMRLLSAIEEYRVWVMSYKLIEKELNNICKEYGSEIMASPEDVEAEELCFISACIKELTSVKFTKDDRGTSLSNLKDWTESPLRVLQKDVKDIVYKKITEKYFDEDESEE